MVEVTVDPATGLIAGPDCPMRVTVELPDYRVPYFPCSHTPEYQYDDAPYLDGEGDADATADTTDIVATLSFPGATR
jgi:hypothetical protein